MITNKRGHLDARNALGNWSFVKWIVDTAMVVGGGGMLAMAPNVEIFSLVFILWLWTFAKEILDTPLVLIWLLGKWSHHRRAKMRRLNRRVKHLRIFGVKI
jgi:hypothetical protein